jgi:hypothetical protein
VTKRCLLLSLFVSDTRYLSCHLLLAQAMVESLLREYPNVLTLRVRMPIVADLVYPRNFITKIIKYDKVRAARQLACCRTNSVCGASYPAYAAVGMSVLLVGLRVAHAAACKTAPRCPLQAGWPVVVHRQLSTTG